MFGVNLPQWNGMFLWTLHSLYVTLKVSGVKLPQWNGPFSQSLTQCQKRVCHSPKFYPRPLKNLHRYVCRICDIMQLWSWGVYILSRLAFGDFHLNPMQSIPCPPFAFLMSLFMYMTNHKDVNTPRQKLVKFNSGKCWI